jgi:hypothetical protein
MLDDLPTQSRELILANMKQSVGLTLGILNSLYPRADLDAAGEGFATTCIDKDALKLVEDLAWTCPTSQPYPAPYPGSRCWL